MVDADLGRRRGGLRSGRSRRSRRRGLRSRLGGHHGRLGRVPAAAARRGRAQGLRGPWGRVALPPNAPPCAPNLTPTPWPNGRAAILLECVFAELEYRQYYELHFISNLYNMCTAVVCYYHTCMYYYVHIRGVLWAWDLALGFRRLGLLGQGFRVWGFGAFRAERSLYWAWYPMM